MWFSVSQRRGVCKGRALAVLDPELGAAVEARNARRRQVVATVMDRFAARYGRPATDERAVVETALFMLTGFEAFEALAGPRRPLEDAAPIILRLARGALGLDAGHQAAR